MSNAASYLGPHVKKGLQANTNLGKRWACACNFECFNSRIADGFDRCFFDAALVDEINGYFIN